MKATAKPEISQKWWCKEKPADIEGAVLEDALGVAEGALAAEKKKSNGETIEAAAKALDTLDAAVDKTIKKECDKKKHKDVIGVLEKYFPLIKAERGRLQELQKKAAKTAAAAKDGEEVDPEETEEKIFQQDYLYKMLKLLRSTGKELNFAFGLDTKNPAASKLLLTRKGKPDRLFKMLKSKADFSKRMITYGRAVPDAQNPKMLVLKLADAAGEPPQIQKAGRAFLRSDKNLKFRKLKLELPGGQVLDDQEPDPEDGPQVAAAAAPGGPGAAAAGGEAATTVQEDLRKEFKEARKRWVAVRQKADQDIEAVKDGVRDYYLTDPVQFPIAMKKIKELDDIMDNLNDDLRNALDAYVSTPLKQQARLQQAAASARQLLEKFTKYVNDSPLLAAIDKKEFADVEIQRPMMAAMRELARTIK